MKGTVLFVFAALCSIAVFGSATTQNAVTFDPRLMLQVQMEDAMSKFFVDFSLKLRHSMQLMKTATLYSQVLGLEFQERSQGKSLEEADGADDFNLESDSFLEIKRTSQLEEVKTHNTLFGEGEESDKAQSKMLLYAAHELFLASKLKFYQTVLKSREIQGNFWMDRYIQLQVLGAGASANPQMLQFLYIKMYRTNLETLKLSLTFQYLSHFVSWVEDELDVQSVLVAGDSAVASVIAADQGDDLIKDKLWAFSTYHSAASIELQAFYIDLYLSMAFNAVQPSLLQAPAASANNNAAFIQEEMTEEATPSESQSQFFPFMMANMAGGAQNPMMYMTYLKLYYLMIQYGGARAALTSVMAEKLAYEGEAKKLSADQIKSYREFSQNMFGGEFARYLSMGANIKYMTSIWEWYMLMYSQMAQPAAAAPAPAPAAAPAAQHP